MSDLDAEHTDIRPLLALIEREGGHLIVEFGFFAIWEARLKTREPKRGWLGLGDTPALAVARLVKAVSLGDQAALTAATGGQDE